MVWQKFVWDWRSTISSWEIHRVGNCSCIVLLLIILSVYPARTLFYYAWALVHVPFEVHLFILDLYQKWEICFRNPWSSPIFHVPDNLKLFSSFTLGVDRHMRPLTFLYRIQCSTTFIWSIFGYNVYFWQHPAPKWIYLLPRFWTL